MEGRSKMCMLERAKGALPMHALHGRTLERGPVGPSREAHSCRNTWQETRATRWKQPIENKSLSYPLIANISLPPEPPIPPHSNPLNPNTINKTPTLLLHHSHGGFTKSCSHHDAPHQAGPNHRPAPPHSLPFQILLPSVRRQDHLLPQPRSSQLRQKLPRRRQDRRLHSRRLRPRRLRSERRRSAQEADLRRDPEQNLHGGQRKRNRQPVPHHRRRIRLLRLQNRKIPGEEALPRAHLLHRQIRGRRQELAAGVPENQAHDTPDLHPRRDRGPIRGLRRREREIRGEGRDRLRRRDRAAPGRRARAVPVHREAAGGLREAGELQRGLSGAVVPGVVVFGPEGEGRVDRVRQRGGAAGRRERGRGGAAEGEQQERGGVKGEDNAERDEEQAGDRRGHRSVREHTAVGYGFGGQGAQGCEDPRGVVRSAGLILVVD